MGDKPMTAKKTARNQRIVRLRDFVTLRVQGDEMTVSKVLSWAEIATRIAKEFPEDAVTRQCCWEIYQEETK